MTIFDLVLWTLRDFVLAHVVWFLAAGFIAALIFVPGTGSAILAALRTTLGKILLACVIAALIGWEARAFVDDSATLRKTLVAERAEQSRVLAEEQARTKAADAKAAEARRQAEAAHEIATAATARETDAASKADTLQEQVDDYADQLAHAPSPDAGCRLSDGDARRLRAIGKPAVGSHR